MRKQTMIRQTNCEWDEKQRYLDRISEMRNVSVKYYTDVINDIDEKILPLVKILNNLVTITLSSCEGHFERKSIPLVYFAILPGQRRKWDMALQSFLNVPIQSIHYVTIYNRFHPKRYAGEGKGPSGPFVDWVLKIDIPEKDFVSKKSFSARCDDRIKQCTCLFFHLMKCYGD